MRALIVDDSSFIREYLRSLLEGHGVECMEAENGQHALRLMEQEEPCELALVDVNMPVMDGLAFVKAVRADPKMDILKILMVTTEAEHDGIKAALDAGADEYLMKPFDEDVLVDRLGIMGIVL